MPFIKTVKLPDRVRDSKVFKGLQHIYAFRYVFRVSRDSTLSGQERIVLVSASSIILADLKGTMKRVVRLEDLDRVFIHSERGATKMIFSLKDHTDPYPLIFECRYSIKNERVGGSEWSTLLDIINEMRKGLTAEILPAEQFDPNEDIEEFLRSVTMQLQAYHSEDEAAVPGQEKAYRELTKMTYEGIRADGPLTRITPTGKMADLPRRAQLRPGEELTHTGEWRDLESGAWCSGMGTPDGMLCQHGNQTIFEPHWSCCGSILEDDPGCVVRMKGENDALIPVDDRGNYQYSRRGGSGSPRTQRPGIDFLHNAISQLKDLPEDAFSSIKIDEELSRRNKGETHIHLHLTPEGARQAKKDTRNPYKKPIQGDFDPDRYPEDGEYTRGSIFQTKVPPVRGHPTFFSEEPAFEKPKRYRKEVIYEDSSRASSSQPTSRSSESTRRSSPHGRKILSGSRESKKFRTHPWGELVPGHPIAPRDLTADLGHRERQTRLIPTQIDPYDPPPETVHTFQDGDSYNAEDIGKVRKRNQPFYFPGSGGIPLDTPELLIDEIANGRPANNGAELYSSAINNKKLFSAREQETQYSRGIEAGWGSNAKDPDAEDERLLQRLEKERNKQSTIEGHCKQLRKQGTATMKSVLQGARSERQVGDNGSMCNVVLRDGMGTAKRRFSVMDWEGLGPCCVLSTTERTGAKPGDRGWSEYIQCSHLRKAGFSNTNQDSLLLSTGHQYWELQLTRTSAERWLHVIYDVCHWLRPGADGAYEAPGFGTLPPGSATPTSQVIPRKPVSPSSGDRHREPDNGKKFTLLQTSPGVHTNIRPDPQVATPELDKYRQSRRNGTTTV
eukprot:TRINITY_DN2655_c0_g2_i1.p1 TRINITY_DN2655_c0_g2~~TRINITY_DN2655_c0_g2_i1.p1  ORF type:complete len:840 (+),score=137.62 TRINITY_DN2655_c0_g2_i1:43-2562(+)